MIKYLIFLLPVILLLSCQKADQMDHSHDDHGHGHEHAGEGTVDTTIWSDNIELFVEYPALRVGKVSTFAAHFTRLEGHQPVLEGQLTVSLVKGNKGIRHKVDTPASPGIFTPALQPLEAGKYQLRFELVSKGINSVINLGTVQVYANETEALDAIESGDQSEPDISFLKEQAWKIPFQTSRVEQDTLYGIIKSVGEWMPSPGTERSLNAPVAGNILFERPGMVEGIAVSKGQVLLRISGEDLNVNSLEAEIKKAKATFDQAKSEFDRKEQLHALKVVPEAEFEEVKKRLEVAETNYQQLLRNYGEKGVAIRAPISGYLKYMQVENGSYVGAGQSLLTIGSERANILKANIDPQERSLIPLTKKIWIGEKGEVRQVSGRVLSVGKKVSRENPMLACYLEVQSPIAAVEGSLAEIQLGYTNGNVGVVIDRAALLEDFGTYKVIVQTGGEGFELRPVQTGSFYGDKVSITKGLKAGEWIVTQGAYQVKMASTAGAAPGHGHAH
ncbi:MAG: efflux RND transporter periplasmic adaptor subunit [Bacteroidetes bacterium]|nr:efflux RND transporter periplasmic adaptor subunit [Bacteroidota bacterium]